MRLKSNYLLGYFRNEWEILDWSEFLKSLASRPGLFSVRITRVCSSDTANSCLVTEQTYASFHGGLLLDEDFHADSHDS